MSGSVIRYRLSPLDFIAVSSPCRPISPIEMTVAIKTAIGRVSRVLYGI